MELMLEYSKKNISYTASDYGLDAWEKIFDISPVNLKTRKDAETRYLH